MCSLDQTKPLLPEELVDAASACSSTNSALYETASHSPDSPPLYQHTPSTHPDEKDKDSQPNSTAVISCRTVMPVSAEVEWFKTLRELQANLTRLSDARRRLNTGFSFTFASGRWRSSQQKRTHESSLNVQVLEELILSGMCSLSQIHPDTHAQTEWASRADEFFR